MSPSISDAAYKSMVANCRQALDRMFADMPRTPPFDVMAVRMWARGFLTSLVSRRPRRRSICCRLIIKYIPRMLIATLRAMSRISM